MVLKPVKVRRSAWRKLRQDSLPAYIDNVLAKTADKAAYEPVKVLLETLAALNKTYIECLAAAVSRERAAVAYKDEIKAQVYRSLDEVANGLEKEAKGEEMYIINAGMSVHKRQSRHTGPLLPPTGLKATTGLPGQMSLQFDCAKEQRAQVETFAVEWRPLGTDVWKNGTYRNAKRITVKELPHRTDVEFRVCCLGTRGRKSKWSGTASDFVI